MDLHDIMCALSSWNLIVTSERHRYSYLFTLLHMSEPCDCMCHTLCALDTSSEGFNHCVNGSACRKCMAQAAGAAIAMASSAAPKLTKEGTSPLDASVFPSHICTKGRPWADAASSCAERVVDLAFEGLGHVFADEPQLTVWLLQWCALAFPLNYNTGCNSACQASRSRDRSILFSRGSACQSRLHGSKRDSA
jgi:hypothetical protein